MPDNPLVSVKMITYNHAPYIAEAIEGVLRQERDFPLELVIGEDCSTDGTRAIVFDYQTRYPDIIRVVTSEANVGMIENSIRLERASRGKYYASCEGDDYWHHPQKLRKQIDFLEAHPEYGFIFSDCDFHEIRTNLWIRSKNRFDGVAPGELQGEALFHAILAGRYYYIAMCTICMRRDLSMRVLEENIRDLPNFPPIGRHGPLTLESARLTRFKYLDESLATHNILPESASKSASDPARILRMCQESRQQRLFYVEKYHCPEKVRRDVIQLECGYLLSLAFRARDPGAAREAKADLRALGLKLTLDQRLKYWGARVGPLHFCCQKLSRLRFMLVRFFRHIRLRLRVG